MSVMRVSVGFEVHVDDPKGVESTAYSRALEIFEPRAGEGVEVTFISEGNRKYGQEWYFDVSATWTPREMFS